MRYAVASNGEGERERARLKKRLASFFIVLNLPSQTRKKKRNLS
jgi:hypothetical protein